MDAWDLEKKAKEAFIDDHFEQAIDFYSQAIDLCPNNADLPVDRAQAHIKLANFTEAVADANKAIELDPTMAKAYLRKGMACIKLKEYETAKVALKTGATLAPGDSRFINLVKECDDHIEEEAGDLPKQSVDKASPSVATLAETPNVASREAQRPSDAPNHGAVSAVAKPKYRHEFYQKPEEVVVTIFAKGIPKDHVTVDYGEQILSVAIEVPGGDVYTFQQRLFGKINPAKCRYDVLSTKVEIRLAKAEPVHWTSLEFAREATVVPRMSVPSATNKPTYPSSKPTAVDWDKLEAQMKKEEKDEKLDGDAALNKFFRDIYGGADEDTRRAMMKSFVESNGTVLSTDWKEVGAKKIEGSPPDGMEMKKWEY